MLKFDRFRKKIIKSMTYGIPLESNIFVSRSFEC